jgi:flagellar biosynthesis protein FlhG
MMNQIIPIASGKGGVGKTILASSIAYSLAEMGKTVLVVDLDLGASNLHSCIGIPNTNPGISSYISGRVSSLEQLIVASGYPRLYLIPGDQMVPGSANIPYYIKMRMIRELQQQVADFVLLDLGAGSSYNTVDFFLSASRGLIISTAEPTAVLNAYAFLKTACYRLLLRSFPRQSEERRRIHEYLDQRIEGTSLSFSGLLRELGGISTESENLARSRMQEFSARVVINMGRSEADISLGARLRMGHRAQYRRAP